MGRGQHPLAGLAGRPLRRRGVGRESAGQLDLPLVAAVDGAGPGTARRACARLACTRRACAATRRACAAAACRRASATLDRDYDAVAAVAAPADQAGLLQGAVGGVEIDIGHVGDLATFDLVAGELFEPAEALEGGRVGGVELGLYLHGSVVTSPG